MSPNRTDRLLGEWSTVAHSATPPAAPGQAAEARRGGSGISVVGAGLLALVLVAAVAWLGNREGPGIGSGGTPPTASVPASAPPSAPPSVPPTPSPSPSPSPSPKTEPTETPAPTIVACAANDLAARITQWEGAAGHRIADVELTNKGSATCFISTMARPQLVDGRGSVLIDGVVPSGRDTSKMAAGDVVRTLVQAGNYCGPAPVAPVTVAFVFSGGGRVVATPLSPTDTTVPPCLGAGSAATIEMQPWAP